MADDAALSTQRQTPPPAAAPRPAAGARRAIPVIVVLLAILAAWEGSKLLFGINDQKLPHVADVAAILFTRSQGGRGPLLLQQLLINAWATFLVALGGFTIGGLLGFGLALLFSRWGLLERGLMPYVIGSQTVPILAIAPMVVVGLGRMGAPDWAPKVVVAAYLTFFPVTIGTLRGLRAATPAMIDLMISYAATPGQTFRKLRLPVALPYVFTALKVAATASVIGAIVAELPAGAQQGIGVMVLNAAQFYNSRPPALYAAILAAALVGLSFYALVALAERLVLRTRGASHHA